jgi:hypothetical protein
MKMKNKRPQSQDEKWGTQVRFSNATFELFDDFLFALESKEEIKKFCKELEISPNSIGIIGRYINEIGKVVCYFLLQKGLSIDKFIDNFCLGANYYSVEKAIEGKISRSSLFTEFILYNLNFNVCWFCGIFGTKLCKMKFYGRCLMPQMPFVLIRSLEYRYTLRCVSTQI